MAGQLLNVRLDKSRIRKANALRARGISLSALVRQAIDDHYERMIRKPQDIDEWFKELYEKYPDPPDAPVRTYNVHNAQEARQAIIDHLNRKKAKK